ncbi:MAG: tRNA A37 threonylcarbamoyladenosine dehydratase [Arenicella sp.]|jgi:tRNA A37 threonylcarbamoyladenosine dehydratase
MKQQPNTSAASTVANTMSDDVADSSLHTRRFGGISRVYGEVGLNRIAAAHVCVIGIGGVGSWVVESLARSGIGAISMIDMDVVSESNINRQILATSQSIGRDKVLVMQDRVLQINPACKVGAIDDFISRDNLPELINPNFDYVIDCIDDFRIKAALIHHCKKNKIKILTVGGAGGQVDPSKVKQCDLSRTKQDVLLARTRKLLRQDYGFARNIKRSFGIACVYSDEQLVYPDGKGGLSSEKPHSQNSAQTSEDTNQDLPSNALNCAGGMGSISHVTGTFAFHACAFVLNQIVQAQTSN